MEGGHSAFRRIGVPIVISGGLFLSHALYLPYAVLSGVLCHVALRLGYGMPSEDDAGSTLGKFWAKRIACLNLADAATRATIGLAIGVSYSTLAWNNLMAWILGTIILIVGMPIVEENVK